MIGESISDNRARQGAEIPLVCPVQEEGLFTLPLSLCRGSEIRICPLTLQG